MIRDVWRLGGFVFLWSITYETRRPLVTRYNSMIGVGATINGKHTFAHYHLVISNSDRIGMPAPKTIRVDIPGSSQSLDLSSALTGRCEYGPRTLTLTLGGSGPRQAWVGRIDEFVADTHGQELTLIFDDQPEYAYHGRGTIKSIERQGTRGVITLDVECDAYKWDTTSSGEDWVWDTFNFDTGIIREYANIPVQGEKHVHVIGSQIPLTPTFTITDLDHESDATVMSLTSLRKWWLFEGVNRFADLTIPPGQGCDLVFEGTYVVTIDVRGGRL